jgi:hypothetical protein
MATDKITIEGLPVGYMYRTVPEFENDSGWRFFSGTEDQEYVNNPSNTMIYNVNTIANYDPIIISYLGSPIGSELERKNNNEFFFITSHLKSNF